MNAKDYKRFHKNIEVHVDMMVTPEMRKHAYASESHELDFQIFRLLSGYALALEEIKILQDQINQKPN